MITILSPNCVGMKRGLLKGYLLVETKLSQDQPGERFRRPRIPKGAMTRGSRSHEYSYWSICEIIVAS